MPENNSAQIENGNLRLPVFGELGNHADPEKIPQIITDYVKKTINDAPILKGKDDSDEIAGGIGDTTGVMFFKIPDDIHLISLVERELYKQLNQIDGSSEDLTVNPLFLALLDPSLPEILRLYYPEENIVTETPLEHELRHFQELEENSKGKFITLRLGKMQRNRKTEIVLQHAHMLAFAPESEMDSFLGPIHPEELDIAQAKDRAANIIDNANSNDSQRLKARKVLDYSPEMTSEEYSKKVASAWYDYRKDDGWVLSKMNAKKARIAKLNSTLSALKKFFKG